MAVPVITGVIVAAENKDAVTDAREAQEEAKRLRPEDLSWWQVPSWS
jgi:hypothetical protein